MSAEEQLAAARRQLAEAEASVLLALASARAALTTVEEENRELRYAANEHRQRMDFYTEREFAQLLKVSESTIARLRKAGTIKPRYIGNQIRYTSLHVAQLAQVGGADGRTAGVRRGLRSVG